MQLRAAPSHVSQGGKSSPRHPQPLMRLPGTCMVLPRRMAGMDGWELLSLPQKLKLLPLGSVAGADPGSPAPSCPTAQEAEGLRTN